MSSTKLNLGLVCVAALTIATGCRCPFAPTQSAHGNLRDALTFHASFDGSVNADFARGDKQIYTTQSFNTRSNAQPGLIASNVTVLARGEGRFGDALHFTSKQGPLIFYKAKDNLTYRTNGWSGSVSFWLQADPEGALPSGFCDPLQITPRAWNDAAFFVEFEKRQDVPFRLGVYADYKVWNPDNRKWEQIPFAEKPLLHIAKPPFKAGKWTHVVFTFENFNTGKPDGVARLYLDGQPQGEVSARTQTFTWDPAATLIQIGVGYVGKFDDLSLFNRQLSSAEVVTLFGLERGLSALH